MGKTFFMYRLYELKHIKLYILPYLTKYLHISHRRPADPRKTIQNTKTPEQNKNVPVKLRPTKSFYGSVSSLHQSPGLSDRKHGGSVSNLRRSVSASNLRTPSKRPTAANAQLSTEYSNKVLKVLQRDESFYSKLKLNGNLKSMTAKQFVEIIGYLANKICGKNIINRQTDYETDIMGFLKTVNYPYTVTKSSLKTPNTLHAFHECVALLAWLSDFLPADDGKDVLKETNEMAIVADECFPSVDYTKYFSEVVRTGFRLWNSDQADEFEELKDHLKDEYAANKLNGNVEGREHLQQITETIKEEIQQLNLVPYVIKNEKRYEAIETRLKHYNLHQSQLKITCDVKADEWEAIKINVGDLQQRIEAKQLAVELLSQKIRMQRYSIAQIKEISEELDQMKVIIAAAKNEISEIKDKGELLLIQQARLTKNKNDLIVLINQKTEHIMKIVKATSVKIGITDDEIRLEPTAGFRQINGLERFFKRLLQATNTALYQCDQEEIQKQALSKELTMRKIKLVQLLNDARAKLQSSENELSAINLYGLEKVEEMKASYAELTFKVNSLDEIIRTIEAQIQQKQKECEDIEEDTRMAVCVFDKRFKELLDVKQKYIEKLDGFIGSIQK